MAERKAPTPALRSLRGPQSAPASNGQLRGLIRGVQERLLREVKSDRDLEDASWVGRRIEQLLDEVLASNGADLLSAERKRLLEALSAEILGLGPIEGLLHDITVTEIMVNSPDRVFAERRGKLELTSVRFEDEGHIKRVIGRILAPLGRRCDESSPYVDARLKDGSRVHAIIPPLAVHSPTLTIRKFAADPMRIQDLLRLGSITPEAAEFLRDCLRSRLNIVISGGTSSGKTTLLNVLSAFIPDEERVISCEDTAELQLRQPNWVQLEARKANAEGTGAVTLRDLVITTLRMRPDRIIVGECRGGEALDMMQAMNTGHDGSMTTLHANSPLDALNRLEVMCLMSGVDWPLAAVRQQIAAAVQLIVHQQRLSDGSRKVTHIAEVVGMEGGKLGTQDIFRFQITQAEEGPAGSGGKLERTGVVPQFQSSEKYQLFSAMAAIPPR